QGLHNAAHQLAESLRSLDQFYEQYEAYKETRAAAIENVKQQFGIFRKGVRQNFNYLNVLLAITDWGNAISSEAQSLAQYNIELANLERDTGTILETHGVRFAEERFRSIGPLGRLAPYPCYPAAVVPGPNGTRYPVTGEPPEKALESEIRPLRLYDSEP